VSPSPLRDTVVIAEFCRVVFNRRLIGGTDIVSSQLPEKAGETADAAVESK